MAQNNTVNQPASLSSTGSTHAPLETSSAYGTATGTGTGNGTAANVDNRSTGRKVKDMFSSGHSSTTTTTGTAAQPTTTGTTTSNTAGQVHTASNTSGSSAQNAVREAGSGIGGVLAGIHGVGEKVRGEFNGAVDEAFGENQGVARNAQISNAGDAEINTGHFATQTKNREGVVPGDHERRNYNS